MSEKSTGIPCLSSLFGAVEIEDLLQFVTAFLYGRAVSDDADIIIFVDIVEEFDGVFDVFHVAVKDLEAFLAGEPINVVNK